MIIKARTKRETSEKYKHTYGFTSTIETSRRRHEKNQTCHLIAIGKQANRQTTDRPDGWLAWGKQTAELQQHNNKNTQSFVTAED